MSKRLDRVLGFGTQQRSTSPMLAKLGQAFLRTVRAAGVFAAWRRVPITTVTITLVIGFWLYDYVSISSAATASAPAPRPSIAAESVAPIVIQPVAENLPSEAKPEMRKKMRRPRHGKSHSAFRRKRVGKDEVDYVANDVTIRLFAPGSTETPVTHSSRQRHIGRDVTVRYFEPDSATKPQAGRRSAVTQAADRSPLVSK